MVETPFNSILDGRALTSHQSTSIFEFSCSVGITYQLNMKNGPIAEERALQDVYYDFSHQFHE